MKIINLVTSSLVVCAGIFPLAAQTTDSQNNESGKSIVIRASDFQEYKNAALMGDGEAMRRVAICYQTGTGVEKDLEEAIIWYGKSARTGNEEAEFDIGTLYRDGIGFPHSDEEAAYWFRKSAQNGNTKGMVEIGRMFLEGKGVQQDDIIAAEYFWRAGSRGNAEGQYQYATMLRDGKGVKRNKEKAIEWFKMAAAQNYKDAAQQADWVQNGKPVVKKRTTSVAKHSTAQKNYTKKSQRRK